MLEYSKTILQKVSFNRELFQKELTKSMRWLHKDEIVLLQIWCIATFSSIYGDIIRDVFSQIS